LRPSLSTGAGKTTSKNVEVSMCVIGPKGKVIEVTCGTIARVAKHMTTVNKMYIKAMLHEAIFLATYNATMTNKKPFKLQRGCHTFATFFATCNAYNNKQDGGRAKTPTSCER